MVDIIDDPITAAEAEFAREIDVALASLWTGGAGLRASRRQRPYAEDASRQAASGVVPRMPALRCSARAP